jgi:hypothetical protein
MMQQNACSTTAKFVLLMVWGGLPVSDPFVCVQRAAYP